MKFYSIFLIFSSVFLLFDGKVESFYEVFKSGLVVSGVVTSNLNGLQIPIPALGATACSTLPHANVSMDHFDKLCYTQRYLFPGSDYKCRTTIYTMGVPVFNIPLPVLTSGTTEGYIRKTGFGITKFVSRTNKSDVYWYNTTFVEVQQAELLYYVINGQNLTLLGDGLITLYTNKGYVYFLCPLYNLATPICSSPLFIFVCTYAQFPPDSDVNALVDPLKDYPYYVGNNLLVMDQNDCPKYS